MRHDTGIDRLPRGSGRHRPPVPRGRGRTGGAHRHLHRLLGRRTARLVRDAGVSTLEIVVIAVGLFALATLLVAGITAAVNSRLAQIG